MVIKSIKNFLPVDLGNRIRKYVDGQAPGYNWKTNVTAWNGYLNSNSTGQVSILNLAPFDEDLHILYKDIIDPTWNITCMYYVWAPGTHIPFHTDGHVKAASTIYMNDTWDINNGGLFLWKDENNKIQVEEPEEFKMIYNEQSIQHGVSMIPPNAGKYRQTIQIFFDGEKNGNT